MDERVRVNSYNVGFNASLREFLSTTCLFFNRVSIDDFAAARRILVEGTVCTDLALPLRTGMTVTLLTPQSFEPWVDERVAVLFEDDALLVVNKPAPLPMHPAGRHYFNTLTKVLERKQLATKDALYPVQRLDRETSGVVVFAKTSLVAAKLAKLLRSQEIEKEYVAICRGLVVPKQGVFSGALTKQQVGEIRNHMVVGDTGLASETAYEVTAQTSDYSLVVVHPKTGRRHQIRAHFAHAGFPLVGDKQYGGHPEVFVAFMKNASSVSEDMLIESFGSGRHFLHARTLRFYHPLTGEKLSFSAKLPEDMVLFCEKNNLSLDFF